LEKGEESSDKRVSKCLSPWKHPGSDDQERYRVSMHILEECAEEATGGRRRNHFDDVVSGHENFTHFTKKWGFFPDGTARPRHKQKITTSKGVAVEE